MRQFRKKKLMILPFQLVLFKAPNIFTRKFQLNILYMLRFQIMSIPKSLNQAIFNFFQTKLNKFVYTYFTHCGNHYTSLHKKTCNHYYMLFALVICQYLQAQNSSPRPIFTPGLKKPPNSNMTFSTHQGTIGMGVKMLNLSLEVF